MSTFFPFLIRHWINENKTGKDNVCKGKLSFLGDIVSKLSCLQFFQGRKSTFLELILHSFHTKIICHWISLKLARFIAFVADFKEFN